MKKALLIIAPVNFRDEEFFDTQRILEKAGVQVTVACAKGGIAKGKLGGAVKPGILLKDARADDYDAVVFIGGGGATVYLDDAAAHAIAQEALRQNKVLAAICVAPAILARAGVLRGRKATVFPDDAPELKNNGALYTGAEVEKDGNLITGSGPQASAEFGRAVAAAITE